MTVIQPPLSDHPCRAMAQALMATACALFALLAWSDTALPALQQKGNATLEETWNPRPDDRDIIVPMPGGLSMAFRVVAVPVSGPLEDMPLRPGSDRSHARPLYDHRYSAGISAPFSGLDVPASWRKGLPGMPCRFYLIAKYEVTRRQWRAVMEDGAIDDEVTADDARPMTAVSWYEALSFTERWTEWLLRNHPDALPRLADAPDNMGYVRLPTEVEWEYAARGGHTIATYPNAGSDAFLLGGKGKFPEYAVYQVTESSHGATGLGKIGTLKPNPLGLYDTAGNAAEMTIDTFRFSMDGHLLGSAGGFVRKGGSFLSGEEEILPGRREETAFFLKDGPQRPRDLGLRPVISGVITPVGDRRQALTRKLGQDRGRAGDGELPPGETHHRQLSDSEKRAIFDEHLMSDDYLAFLELLSWIFYCDEILVVVRTDILMFNLLSLKAQKLVDGDLLKTMPKGYEGESSIALEKVVSKFKDSCARYIAAVQELAILPPSVVLKVFNNVGKDDIICNILKKHWILLLKGETLTPQTVCEDLENALDH